MSYLLIILFLIIFFLIAWQNQTNALAMIIVLLPSYLIRFKIFFLPTTLLEIMLLLLFGIFLLKNFYNLKNLIKKGYRQIPFCKIIILILSISFLSVFIAPNHWKALGLWRAYFLEPIIFFIIFTQSIKEKKDLKKILYALGFSSLIIALFGIYQKITGNFISLKIWQNEENRRITSFYTSPNAVGLFLAPIIMIYLGWLIQNKKNLKKVLFQTIIIILSFLAILFTKSAGTYLGLFIALSFFVWKIIKSFNKEKTIEKIKSGIIIFLTLIIIFNQGLFLNHQIQKTFFELSSQNRLTLWQGTWNFLTDNPKNFLFGAGIFGFPQIQEKFRDPLKMEPLIYPHNIFLNFWIEIGLLGLIAFIYLIIIFFKKTTAQKKDKNFFFFLGLQASMITIIIHGLVDVPYFKNDLAILFWTIIGLSALNINLIFKKNDNFQK